MCINKTNYYVGLSIIISVIIGIIAGITGPLAIPGINRLLLAILATSTLALIILAFFVLFRNNKQLSNNLKTLLTTLLYSGIASFVFALISLSVILTQTVISSIIFGITIGVFSLLLMSIVLTIKYLIDN